MKNQFILITCIILIIGLISISCDGGENSFSAHHVSTTVLLSVKDSQSQSVFDPDNNLGFNKEKISIFYEENNVYKTYFLGNHGGYNGYSFSSEDEPNAMTLYPYDLGLGNIPKHIIKWNEQDSDTLRFEVDVRNNGGYVSITKVWYNEELAWDVATDNEIRRIEVIK